MNQTVELIMGRRSVKSYSPKKISEEDLKTIVESGIWAPNGRNAQMRFFSAVQNSALMEKMIGTIREVRKDNTCKPFYDAPAVVYVSVDHNNPFGGLDAGAAMENMILTSSALNIDSCFMIGPLSLFEAKNAEELKNELGIPAGFKPICALILGYRADGVEPKSSRNAGSAKYIL